MSKNAVIAGGLMLAVVCPATASSSPALTTWTTYLYQGPGWHYVVVDEVPQATQVDVDGCGAGWCKVRLGSRIGYLRSDVVAGAPAASDRDLLPKYVATVPASKAGPCVVVVQTGGNGGVAPTRVCQK